MPIKRALTPDELNQLEAEGYNTSKYKGELIEFPDPPDVTSKKEALGRGILANFLPATAGAAGFAAGANPALPWNAAAIAAAPETMGASLLVPLIGGVAVSALGSGAMSKVQDTLTPDSVLARNAIAAQEHPWITKGAQLTATAATMAPNPMMVVRAGAGLGRMAIPGAAGRSLANNAEREALKQVSAGAGIGAGSEIGRQALSGEGFHAGRILEAAGEGALFNSPTALGHKVMGSKPAPTLKVDNADALMDTIARVKPNPEQIEAMKLANEAKKNELKATKEVLKAKKLQEDEAKQKAKIEEGIKKAKEEPIKLPEKKEATATAPKAAPAAPAPQATPAPTPIVVVAPPPVATQPIVVAPKAPVVAKPKAAPKTKATPTPVVARPSVASEAPTVPQPKTKAPKVSKDEFYAGKRKEHQKAVDELEAAWDAVADGSDPAALQKVVGSYGGKGADINQFEISVKPGTNEFVDAVMKLRGDKSKPGKSATKKVVAEKPVEKPVEPAEPREVEGYDGTENLNPDLEQKNENIQTPLGKEVADALAAKKKSTEPTTAFKEAVEEVNAGKRGLTTKETADLPTKGKINTKTGQIEVNPKTETLDTRPHEGSHDLVRTIYEAKAKGSKRAADYIDKLEQAQKEGLDAYNKERAGKGLEPVDHEEFAVSQQGHEFLKQQLNLLKETKWKKWWNDTKALYNTAFKKNPSMEELRRVLNFRYVNENVTGRTFKKGGVVTNGSQEKGKEEGMLLKPTDKVEAPSDKVESLPKVGDTIKVKRGIKQPIFKDGNDRADQFEKVTTKEQAVEFVAKLDAEKKILKVTYDRAPSSDEGHKAVNSMTMNKLLAEAIKSKFGVEGNTKIKYQGADEGLPRTPREQQQESPEFKKWFSESKVVNKDGKPVILYHGSKHVFTDINMEKADPNALFGPGFYMTDSKSVAGGDAGYSYKKALSGKNSVRLYPYDKTKSLEENITFSKQDLWYEQRQIHPNMDNETAGQIRQWIDSLYFKADKRGDNIEAFTTMDGSPNVMPLYANVKNPLDMDSMDNPITVTTNGHELEVPKLAHTVTEYLKTTTEDFGSANKQHTIDSILQEDFSNSNKVRDTYDIISEYVPKFIITNALKQAGYDGITHTGGLSRRGDGTPHKVWITFEPIQVKSALGNVGSFDGANTDIRMQNSNEGLPKTDYESDILPPDPTKQSFFRRMSATFDRVAEISPKHAQAARDYENRKSGYMGMANTALVDLSKYSHAELNKVMAEHRNAYRNDTEPVLDGPNDQAISKILSDYYGKIADIRNELGIRINNRQGGKNEYYVPDMMNAQTIDTFINNPMSPEATMLKREWAEHVMEQEGENGRPLEEIMYDIDRYIEALGGAKNNYKSLEFGAIRKAAGYGLPESMRDPDAMNTLSRYSRRAASDIAFFQEIQSKPDIAVPLHIKDQNGELPDAYKESSMPQDQRIKDMMKWITNDIGGVQHNSPLLRSLTRLVNNALLGPATGIRDLVSVPMNALPYVHRFSDLGAAWKGMMSMRENSRAALESGARQPQIDKLAFDDVLQSPNRFAELVGRAADGLRKYQGREFIENLSRDITFSMGKELGRNNIIGARAGNARSKAWLKKFGDLVDGDILTMEGADLEKALNQIGKNFTDRNQGTYGGRGLPVGMVESQFAPFFALQKWSVEKANVIYKDVYKPFMTGENRIPMLTYTLGSLMTGAAIQQLNTLMAGKKGIDPTIKEALDKGDAAAVIQELGTLMQLGSYAGIMSDGIKTAVDTGIRGRVPRNVVSFPTATATIRTAESLADMAEALRQNEDPWKVLKAFTIDLMSNNIQAMRMLANRTINDDTADRKDKFRDVRVFNELEGKPAGVIAKTNPYLGLDAKEFKQTKDVKEAAGMAGGLVRKAAAKSGGSVEEFRKSLSSLKGNSYQTMPSPETSPEEFKKFYSFLVRTQGADAANARVKDYVMQRHINKAKSSLIP